ncbi:MAG: hypothetical protein WC659_04760 [Patescibacteria group bacterium]
MEIAIRCLALLLLRGKERLGGCGFGINVNIVFQILLGMGSASDCPSQKRMKNKPERR